MYFYDMIKDMSDEEIEKHLSYEIRELEVLSKINNKGDIIGYKLSYNPSEIDFMAKNKEDAIPIKVRCFHGGYVPKGTKVVYGCSVDKNGIVASGGMYYIVDDDSYIYEFAKYIKNKHVINEEDFFEYVLSYLENYFGVIAGLSRDEMFKLILKNNRTYHEPIREHKLSDFKKKGNAMCSEYSIMANNILSVFGFDSYVIIGREKDEKTGTEGHAFNFVSYLDENGERNDALIDFANSVGVYDYNFNKIGDSPYIIHLDNLDNEFVDKFLTNEVHIVNSDYYFVIVGNTLLQLVSEKTRDYYVSNKIMVKNMSNGRQK